MTLDVKRLDLNWVMYVWRDVSCVVAWQEAMEACQSDWLIQRIAENGGQFMCNKCKSNKTSYSQAQTRSSDEPMTTWVYVASFIL